MIKQDKTGKWLAKCDICSWKSLELEREDAENKLSNHITVMHKKGIKGVKKQKLTISPDRKPPKIPSPIKEH